jgi:hypothetical protein
MPRPQVLCQHAKRNFIELLEMLGRLTLPLFRESHSRELYAARPCCAANQFFSNVMGLT